MISFISKLYSYVFGRTAGAEAVRYLIVGGLTTVVSFGTFALLVLTQPFEATAALGLFSRTLTVTHTDIFNLISIVAAIIFAYVTNKLIVFRKRSGSKAALIAEFIKFTGSRIFGMLLELGVVWLFYSPLGLSALTGKIAAAVLVIIANYIFSKFIVFKPEVAVDKI